MASCSWTICRVRGLPLRLHLSFFPIFALFSWQIAAGLPAICRNMALPAPQMAPLAFGVLLAALFFTCLMAHELAHVAIGTAGGARFSDVTLFFLGGAASLRRAPTHPKAEAAMAGAGPLASALLATFFLALWRVDALPAGVRLAGFYLCLTNASLALFNLIPAFPMDGGRLLRALLAQATSRLKATQIAVGVGALFEIAMAIAGALAGLWILPLIAALLFVMALGELKALKAALPFEGRTVRDAMQPASPALDVEMGLHEALQRMEREMHPWLFVSAQGRVVGVVTAADLRADRTRGRAESTFFQTLRDRVRYSISPLRPDGELLEAARLLERSGAGVLPVLDEERLVGQLTRRDLRKALAQGPAPDAIPRAP